MKERAGVMVVELLVALAISGVVVAGSVMALRTIVQSEQTLDRAHAAIANRRNNLRSVQTLASLAFAGSKEKGTDSTFAFKSFCDLPEGWRSACDIRILRITTGSAPTSLLMTSSTNDSIRIGTNATVLRYLANAANGGTWRNEWYDTDRLPLGIAFIDASDTLFIRFQHPYDAAN